MKKKRIIKTKTKTKKTKRSLGCVLFEMLYLRKAFPNGHDGNPKIPNLGIHLLFRPILKK